MRRHIVASSGMDLGLYFILRQGEQQYVCLLLGVSSVELLPVFELAELR